MTDPNPPSGEDRPRPMSRARGVHQIHFDVLRPSRSQPRESIDPDDPAFQALVESIRQHGLLQPIVVRQLEDGTLELIAGHRRWEALKLLGEDHAACWLLEATDDASAILTLVENTHREDLSFWDVSQHIGGYRDGSAAAGRIYSQVELAQLFRFSEPKISQLLKVYDRLPAKLWQDIAGAEPTEMRVMTKETLLGMAALENEDDRAYRLLFVIQQMRRVVTGATDGEVRDRGKRRPSNRRPGFGRTEHRDGAESVRIHPERLTPEERQEAILVLKRLLDRLRGDEPAAAA